MIDESTTELVRAAVARTGDPEGAMSRMAPIVSANPSLVEDPDTLQKVAAIAGTSRALSRGLASNPGLIHRPTADLSVPAQLRSHLIAIAGDELTGKTDLTAATALFSDAIDNMVEQALGRAQTAISERHLSAADLPFAVIAMGKWAARELNYYSDVDLVFVHEPPNGGETEARKTAIALASRIMADLSGPTFEGCALIVDADLRPEGTIGPLSRSLDSYRSYYERWAEPWELQALMKTRAVAGDPALGERFAAMADAVVWDRGLDVEALRSIRLLKARAEDGANPRDIKRAAGGIRDIEFTVQILQLVHGRFDTDLRVRSTLDAIAALGRHEYIETEEAERLSEDYRFLRDLEHRIQLWDLEQTHILPTDPGDRERIGRSLGFTADPIAELDSRLTEVRREVRDLHERLYFRPILDSLAGVESALLDPEAASLRLAALGFRDVTAASKAFQDMTGGLSRRSRMMQQVLPLMLDWLSQSPDPDLGLSQMRLLLANTTDQGALVSLLQNTPVAGERLCLLLGTGRLLGQLIDRLPEFIPRLATDDIEWDVRDAPGAVERLSGFLDARPDPDAKVGTIRRFVRRRQLRIAARDILDAVDLEVTLGSLSDSGDAAMAGALHIIEAGGEGFGVIAMGKWGGRELAYGSDLDLMYVYAERADRDRAQRTTTELGRILSEPGRHGDGYQLDADLRPEGRKGPMARSLDGFRRYYEEWVAPWEVLALVRARPVAGDRAVLEGFAELLEPLLWRPTLDPAMAREIRVIKTRVESERIPMGEDPDFHLKLGPGGLSDVEFLTQLLQLEHGGRTPELRVTGTLPALRMLHDVGVLAREDFEALHDSYHFLSRVRLRLQLQRGRASESLPTDQDQLGRLAASLGFDRRSELREQYQRHTRRARRVFESLFYE